MSARVLPIRRNVDAIYFASVLPFPSNVCLDPSILAIALSAPLGASVDGVAIPQMPLEPYFEVRYAMTISRAP